MGEKKALRLEAASLEDEEAWASAGFELPRFDRAAVEAKTRRAPEWLHFGAGNIFRAFPAAIQQRLLDQGKSDSGIVVAEGFDYGIIDKVYRPFDNLCVLVILKANGTVEKRVIGSVVESLVADSSGGDWDRLKEIFASPSLKMVSFTITEKGYSLGSGGYSAEVAAEMSEGPAQPRSIMGKVASLCLERYRRGASRLALVSMDNCSHNGERLSEAVRAFAASWTKDGLADPGFLGYIENGTSISFPWTMIDKITPRPDESVRTMLREAGLEGCDIVVTKKRTYTSSFVNAEEAEYLVVEDNFPNGRPPLEVGGVMFTTRETVERVERMKVSTCLNPLHTSLAIFGCLLGYKSIHEEMGDSDLVSLVERIGYVEGLPVVVDPKIIEPRRFLREVLEIRFPNPFMPDTPQRIASDTSQKLPIRFGETIKAYLARRDLSISSLTAIPLVFAGWLRYLMGVDDAGSSFEPSPDPRLEELRAHVAGIALGDEGPFHGRLEPILSDATIFGVNLYDAGLGEIVERRFAELVSAPGAVRRTLSVHLR